MTDEQIKAERRRYVETMFERLGHSGPFSEDEIDRLIRMNEFAFEAWQAASAATAKRSAELEQSLRDLLWAATERDRKNRIRQFDEFVDSAKALLATQ